MKLPLLLVLPVALLSGACSANPDELTGGEVRGGATEGEEGAGEGTPEALQCTAKPDGRAYKGFDGTDLSVTRANENVGVNRARVKPYAVMASEYKRVLGLVPEAIKTAGTSFDDPPERWYAESTHSGVSMNALLEISFEGCLAYAKATPSLAAAPTAETATTECTKLMRKAWARSPSPDEIASCTDLATAKLAAQKDVTRRWAYVCASVLSSSQFLTF
jgi:hypothetical protein